MTGYTHAEAALHKYYGAEMTSCAVQQSLHNHRQHRTLMNLIRVDDSDTKQEIAARSLHIVFNIANQYKDHGVDIVNLISEGIRGLIHALESFEHAGGFRFESHAIRCIRQSIECSIMNQIEPE